MQKMVLVTSLLMMVFLLPLTTMADVKINIDIPLPRPPNIRINIPAPPHIQFAAPPKLVVVPETYVYVAPDVAEEIFFSDGWWWRPWKGRWYRSQHHNSGWQYYKSTPSFYQHVPRNWRNDYRQGHWRGHRWNADAIPHTQVQKNWKSWKAKKHWEKKQTWGVEGLRRPTKSRPPSEWEKGKNSRHPKDNGRNRH
ncbi:MAG: hypothetical protein KJ630_12100 [Proteobacteria bacterium]|nr:hypothetical protein [Pseudomonadota bacterium]